MDLYGELVSRVLHPGYERVRGRSSVELHRYLEQTQWRSRDELAAIQLGALRRLLDHAWAHVPAQRASMESVGFHPSRLRDVSDLAALPIVTRAELRAQGDARASTAPPFCTIRKHTSGSTGEPLLVAYDRGSEDWRQATKLRGWGWAGYRMGRRTMFYWGAGQRPASRVQRAKIDLDRGLKREHYVDCGRRNDEDLAAVVEQIRRVRPSLLVGFSQALADLAKFVVQNGRRDWRDIPVLCGAERVLPGDRAMLEQAFGKGVFETYGCREVMLMAAECEAHAGMHLSTENLLLEVVVRDEHGARPARPGETGEVVVTDLHNYGMPFVRYALGDAATLMADGPCACGRSLPRIASVDGRITETLSNASGGRVSGLLFAVILLPVGERIKAYQAVQHADRSITLKVVANGLTAADEALLGGEARKYFGDLPFRVARVDDLPLAPSGKRRLVVVEH